MLTTNPPVPLLRSISGRLYAAIGVLCVALLATNAETIIYSGTVAAGANAVEQESIDAMRAVDGFDELLDQYRRAVTVNSDARAQQRPETSAGLDEIELRLATIPAEFSAKDLHATAVTERLAAHVAELEKLAHTALRAAALDDVEAPQSAQRFEDFTNLVEDDVATWKAAMREATATELATMNDRATAMRRAYFMVIAGACLVGVAALLLSPAVLHRLRRLATMLSLAAGDIAIEVPFRGERDEVGRLADVLQVFRGQAGRVMESEANLHAALESMVEAIVISSADMQVVMHNQRLVTMFDLPRRDYVGMRTNELADGRLEMDTNVVERAMRPVTITRKNSLFAGSHAGARRWAIANTLIQSCKLNGVEPLAYLTDVLQRIISGRTKNDELHALLPWNWHPPATFTGV